MRIPRLLIAAPASGAGKTTAAAALILALRRQGLAVAPFKAGPDYIDPGHLARAAGAPCRNLDGWMVSASALAGILFRGAAGADVAVVEGMMGLFDGVSGGSDAGSAADLARRLRIPVLLVIDGSAQAGSAGALVAGFARFDRRVRVAGVILNRVAGPGHARLLSEAVRRGAEIPVVGAIPQDPDLFIPERHLGLVPAWEDAKARARLRRIARKAPEWLDVPAILRIARSAQGVPGIRNPGPGARNPERRAAWIAYARDEAFGFYYPDNLDLLESLGARMIPFSPLRDQVLPRGIGGLYLGGGFPEVFAKRLSANRSMRATVARAVGAGIPTYAECGGLMYLARSIRTLDGRSHPMCGVLPGAVRMTERLQDFGYTTVRAARDSILARKGESARGHEFHRSAWTPPAGRAAYRASKRAGGPDRPEGFARGNLLASYVHLHFAGCPEWAKRFVEKAKDRQTKPGTRKNGN